MPASRTRLRPWLEQKIESKSVPGLTWLDKENKMFAIPWKHAARHGWEMDRDACIFMQWAVHTGKFRPGVTDPDPKTWKANFRSALNSLPDIKQVKDKSINKGSEAVRVYRMLEEVPKKKDKKPKTTRKRKVKNVERDTKPDGQDSKDHLNHPGGQTTDTSNVSMQETKVDSTDELGLPVHHFGEEGEAVECSTTVEVIADSTNDFYGYFQVSPMNATDFDDEAAIIEMAQALEVDQTQWQETRADAPEMDAKHCIELKGLPGNTEDGSNCENCQTQIILLSAELSL